MRASENRPGRAVVPDDGLPFSERLLTDALENPHHPRASAGHGFLVSMLARRRRNPGGDGVVDRHTVLAEEEFFALAAARAKRHELAAFRSDLLVLGYAEDAVTRTLGIEGPHALTRTGRELWPRYIIPGDEPLSVLIRLFLLCLPEPEQVVRRVLGKDHLSLLRDLRLLSDDGAGQLRSPIGLYPVGSLLVATDWWREPKGGPDASSDRVMPLGRDSYGLARWTASASGVTAVDLCTGSGVGALTAAMRFDRVVGVDINPRAVNFARFNALLNGLGNCSFELGDLYGPVEDLRFDLITANPPFVPAPGSPGLLYRDGGPSGEDVLRQIVGGYSAHLKEHGVGFVVTDLVEHRGTRYEEKLTRWLGTDAGFSATVLKRPAETIFQYASSHLLHTAPSGVSPTMFEWIDHYRAEGIEEIARGYIAVGRSDRPGTRIITVPIERAIEREARNGLIEELLQRVEEVSFQRVTELRFSPRFQLGNVQLLPEGGDLTRRTLPYLVVSAMEIAARRDGAISLDALLAAFREAGFEVGSQRREDLERIVRQLYVSGSLDVVPAEPGVEPPPPAREHEAAMKMWWSR
jgi:Methyltransferase small domain